MEHSALRHNKMIWCDTWYMSHESFIVRALYQPLREHILISNYNVTRAPASFLNKFLWIAHPLQKGRRWPLFLKSTWQSRTVAVDVVTNGRGRLDRVSDPGCLTLKPSFITYCSLCSSSPTGMKRHLIYSYSFSFLKSTVRINTNTNIQSV